MSLTRLRLKTKEEDAPHSHDVQRIVDIAASRGYEISHADARQAWEDFSETMAAGWMSLDEEDDNVWFTISHRFEEV